MSFQTVEQLQAEIERLGTLVETGYEEGWQDAHAWTDVGMYVNWNHSKTRAALQPKEAT